MIYAESKLEGVKNGKKDGKEEESNLDQSGERNGQERNEGADADANARDADDVVGSASESKGLSGFSLKGLSCTLTKVFDAGCKTLQGFGGGGGGKGEEEEEEEAS